jgi:hypothetical protein
MLSDCLYPGNVVRHIIISSPAAVSFLTPGDSIKSLPLRGSVAYEPLPRGNQFPPAECIPIAEVEKGDDPFPADPAHLYRRDDYGGALLCIRIHFTSLTGLVCP